MSRNIFNRISKEKLLDELITIIGKPFVSDKPHDLYPYSYDGTESEAHMPDFVVLPETVNEILQLIKFCNQYKIPIVPYVSGNNVGGLTIPEYGGIICDMGKRMKKIIKVHESLMYAILEPGVTWGQLKKFLDENHPNLKYPYTYAPPYASVVANALLSGLSNHSCAYGGMGDLLNGLEVVLNTGELVRTGSCFLSKDFNEDNWFTRYPMPDLTGLFICWQGTTGIVTKAAVQLWPKKKYNTALIALIYGSEECAEIVRELGRTECCEDVSAMSSTVAKITFGIENPPEYDDEPDYAVFIALSGNTMELLTAKVNYIKKVFDKIKEKDNKRIFLTNFATFANLLGQRFATYYDLPTVIFPMVEYSGVTWVGTYANPDKIGVLFEKCREIFNNYKRTPILFMKSMKSSHYCVFMAILPYKKFEEMKEIKQLQEKFLNLTLDYGCIPYKTPRWMTDVIRERCDPNWLKLLERIKRTMDPSNIFNPGRWGLE
jgi:glycolate oxidase